MIRSLLVALGLFLAGAASAQTLGHGLPFEGLLNGYKPFGVSYAPPAATQFKYLADSRGQNGEVIGRSTTFTIGHQTGNGYPGWFGTAINNVILDANNGHGGVGASTSLNELGRMRYPYFDGNLWYTQETITSGVYTSGSGQVVLTVTPSMANPPAGGQAISVSATGTGSVANLNGLWTLTSSTATTLTYTATGQTGLTLTIGGGTTTPGCALNAPNYCANTYAAFQGGVLTGSSSSANWAETVTGTASDGKWSQALLGDVSLYDNTANRVWQMTGVNDDSPYGSDSPAGISTINNYVSMLTLWRAANNVVYLADETPQGGSTVWLENKACVSCASVTSTNASQFLDASGFSNSLGAAGAALADTPLIDDKNVVYTWFASCSGHSATPNSYTVSGNTYTFCDAGTLPASNAYITYRWAGSPVYVTSTREIVRHDYLHSSQSTFSTSASGSLVSYGLPGALNAATWPNVVGENSWEALSRPDCGPTSCAASDGVLADALHPNLTGGILVAKAHATAVAAAEPTLTTSLAQAPTANNWQVSQSNGVAKTFANGATVGAYTLPLLPAIMRDGGSLGSVCTNAAAAGKLQVLWLNQSPQEIAVGGPVSGGVSTLSAVNTANTGGVTGSINCTTGAFTVTTTNTLANGSNNRIVIVEDPSNLLNNPLLDSATPAYNGTAVSCPTNFTCSGTLPGGWSTPTIGANLATALANGACSGHAPPCATGSITSGGTVTDADGTWPSVVIQLSGVLNAITTSAVLFAQTLTLPNNAIVAGTDAWRGGGYSNVAAGSNGYLYGLEGVGEIAQSVVPSYTAPWGTGAGTQLSCSGMNFSGGALNLDTLSLAAANGFAGSDGTYIPQRDLGDLCPTTNISAGTLGTTLFEWAENYGAGPFSSTVTLWRGQFRVRTQ